MDFTNGQKPSILQPYFFAVADKIKIFLEYKWGQSRPVKLYHSKQSASFYKYFRRFFFIFLFLEKEYYTWILVSNIVLSHTIQGTKEETTSTSTLALTLRLEEESLVFKTVLTTIKVGMLYWKQNVFVNRIEK